MEQMQLGAAFEIAASVPAGQRRSPEATCQLCEVRANDVESLARLSLGADMERVNAFVEAVRVRPVPLESVYLDLLQGAARRLGDWWLDDKCSFADVTIGTSRLRLAMMELGAAFHRSLVGATPDGRVLLTPAPGEQHTFGVAMVAEFFVRDGFDVAVAGSVDAALRDLARGDWFDVVGLSVGCCYRLDSIAAAIERVRAVSRNRRLAVLVGGPAFDAHPDYATRVGADAAAADARQAPQVAREVMASFVHPL